MSCDDERRNESFAHQLGDALSPNPFNRAKASPIWADSLSRSLANDAAGNLPSAGERAIFGGPNVLSSLQQFLNDRLFSR